MYARNICNIIHNVLVAKKRGVPLFFSLPPQLHTLFFTSYLKTTKDVAVGMHEHNAYSCMPTFSQSYLPHLAADVLYTNRPLFC